MEGINTISLKNYVFRFLIDRNYLHYFFFKKNEKPKLKELFKRIKIKKLILISYLLYSRLNMYYTIYKYLTFIITILKIHI